MASAEASPTLLCSTAMASPVGRLTLVAGDNGLVAVLWEGDDPRRVPTGRVEPRGRVEPGAWHPTLVEAERQLCAYFAGERMSFDLPLDFRGTEFQRRVWSALLEIPFGETRSYRQIADSLGDRKAVRAVGAANGKNPISIIAPCHRVIGSSGKLTGFAGGLEAKAYLLRHEGVTAPTLF